jgi:molybdate transport system substrate-binding protein
MRRPTSLPAALAMLALLAGPARAAEVKLLTAGALKQVVLALAPVFEQRTGDRLIVDNDTAGGLARRIAGGEAFDLAILPPRGVDDLAASGQVAPASKRIIARTGVGILVAEGTRPPDISTVDALRRTLLEARSIAYIDPAAGGSSGVIATQLMQRLGIAEQVKAKTVLVQGGLHAEHVAAGEAQLGMQQISEILAAKGVVLVGPLPDAVQSYTSYAAVISATARQPAAAQAFIGLLTGADGAAAMQRNGLQPAP